MIALAKHAEAIWRNLPPWLYKLGAQYYADEKFPRHLFIEVTATCNLTCDYCPREKVKQDMPYAMFKAIIDEAAQFGPRSFSLHLFGEPTLWPHLIEGIRYIKQRDKHNVVLLTTNGTKLNELAEDLLEAKVDEILWTVRPEAKFTEETKDALRLATLRGTTKFRVRIVEEITSARLKEEWGSWPYLDRKNVHNYGGTINPQKYGAQPTATRRYPCYHLWLAPAVSWNGKLLICCSDPKQESELGVFPEMSIAAAWRGSGMNAIRQGHLKGEYVGACKDCDVWKTYPDIWFNWQK